MKNVKSDKVLRLTPHDINDIKVHLNSINAFVPCLPKIKLILHSIKETCFSNTIRDTFNLRLATKVYFVYT